MPAKNILILALLQQIYTYNIKNYLHMESNRKRRGISLSHNSFRSTPLHQPAPHSLHLPNRTDLREPSCPVTTRIQYVRYPIPQNLPRQQSAPKPKINFNYTLNQPSCIQQNNSVYNSSFVGEVSYIQPKPTLLQKYSQVTNKIDASIVEYSDKAAIIPGRYESFEQCKDAIGKRLFGTTKLSNSKANCQNSRLGSFKIPQVQQFNTNFAHMINQTPPKPQTSIKSNQNPLGESLKINIPKAEEPKQKGNYFEAIQSLKTATKSQEKCEVKNEQAVVVEKAKPKQKKDPIKLQEMQRRLLQIIKICDENV